MTAPQAQAAGLPNARFALYQIVHDRLVASEGTSLADFIALRRQPGTKQPYRHIAQELVDITGIDITHEAVRRWHLNISGPGAAEALAAAAAQERLA